MLSNQRSRNGKPKTRAVSFRRKIRIKDPVNDLGREADPLITDFNDDLLPQLAPNRNLPAYFPLLERIAENKSIPPARLLELLTLYIRKRVEEDKGDGGLRLWHRGNQVTTLRFSSERTCGFRCHDVHRDKDMNDVMSSMKL